MKVWIGYGTEHSANLVIVGTFKTAKDAAEAMEIIVGLSSLVLNGIRDGKLSEFDGLENGNFSSEQMEFFDKVKAHNFLLEDMNSFLYDFNSSLEDTKLIITTDEMMINGLINSLISKSAKVEIYSAHDY